MRAKDRGISTAYYEAIAPTYDEAKDKALKGIRLSERDVRFREVGTGPEGVKVRAISIRTRVEEAIRDFQVFLDGLDISGDVDGREEAGLIFLEVEGPNMGLMIGRSGSNLEAIEYLLNIIHNRRFTSQKHVILDIGGYRRKEIDYIDSLLEKAIQHIANKGKPFGMPPMSAKRRKLTHLLLRKYPGHISKSIGEEPRRLVEIRRAPQGEDEPPVDDITSDYDYNEEGFPL
jgi:spoIIIJ-associated protein